MILGKGERSVAVKTGQAANLGGVRLMQISEAELWVPRTKGQEVLIDSGGRGWLVLRLWHLGEAGYYVIPKLGYMTVLQDRNRGSHLVTQTPTYATPSDSLNTYTCVNSPAALCSPAYLPISCSFLIFPFVSTVDHEILVLMIFKQIKMHYYVGQVVAHINQHNKLEMQNTT